jgi:cell division protein ZapE
MDMFFEHVSMSDKRRVHFNEFMLEVHDSIHQYKKSNSLSADPVPAVARQLAAKTRLLCFDEFQVTDIADAMILKRLFGTLWEERVAVFATSNRAPEDLYMNGLQRFLFLPFIEELKQKCEYVDMNSSVDYRDNDTEPLPTFIYPHNSKAEEAVKRYFIKVTGTNLGELVNVQVTPKRKLICVNAIDNLCAVFSFKELCDRPLGAGDYIALTKRFPHVCVTDIPQFTAYTRDVMRRFILLIDELYNSKVKLMCTAAVPIKELYSGDKDTFDEFFAIDRTMSRLTEMQTEDYLSEEHIVRK